MIIIIVQSSNMKLTFFLFSIQTGCGNMLCAWALTRTTFLMSIFAKSANPVLLTGNGQKQCR